MITEVIILAKLGCCSSSGSVNDAVCTTVAVVNDTTLISIWENNTNFMINGTILIENNGPANAWAAGLIINGDPVPVIIAGPGESHSITVNNLISIEVQGSGPGSVFTPVKVSFSLNYNF